MSNKTFKIVVLISGNGTNLQAIIDAVQSGHLKGVEIKAVISNKETAYGLTRATNAGIETRVFSLQKYLKEQQQGQEVRDRSTYGVELAKIIRSYSPNLVVCAGWMLILPSSFLESLNQDPVIDIINVHPALPGQYPGTHAIERAYNDFKQGKIQHTGLMIHRVVEEIDAGQVIVTADINIEKDDTLESLEDRFHKQEHKSMVEALHLLSTLYLNK
ncbi:hypothetical protein CYY_005208 [Polysphondylium violaceum]|uniref:Phosphoribosylglycinamide formyltransferase n=1 Tax=Polysphondylium violaceum TaxID=133409 RepID=A0A8J4V727_9MYCE|nr:hypothetical protein CYY_005208 [Polysphondylium violaceum]